jgi:hypothetical protein
MLEALGNIGDLLGGVGVFVTLIYLAVQIRQNTIASRSEAYQAAVVATSAWTQDVGTDSDSTRILQAGIYDHESLGPLEQAQFSLMLAAFFRNLENIHFQFASGAIDENLWAGWANRIATLAGGPGVQAWWEISKDSFSQSFQDVVDHAEKAAPPIPPPAV